jgi:hypothetical protein
VFMTTSKWLIFNIYFHLLSGVYFVHVVETIRHMKQLVQ